MRILCIDTSLGASVALWDSEAKNQVLASRSSQDSRSHAEHLTELVSELRKLASAPSRMPVLRRWQ